MSAVTITITPVSSPTNNGDVVGNVPADSGTCFLRANDPAMPSTSTIEANRPNSIAKPIAVLKKVVLADNPPKALPLLFAPDVNA